MVQGFAPAPKSSRAVAFCCGIPNISNQIKVAENTRDLSGLVAGGAGVRRLRPQGQRPAGSGLSEELALSHRCHCPFPLESCRFEGKAQQALGWRTIRLLWQQVLLLRMSPVTFHTNYWIFWIPLRKRTQVVTHTSICEFLSSSSRCSSSRSPLRRFPSFYRWRKSPAFPASQTSYWTHPKQISDRAGP